MQKMYLLCFVYCVCTIAVTCVGILQLRRVFMVFISHKQDFPHKLMESVSNLFIKLIPLYSLPVWFSCTTSMNRTSCYSCTVAISALVWR